MTSRIAVAASLLLLIAPSARAADYPAPVQADCTIKDFSFASGATLPAVTMHYRTIGQPHRNAAGIVDNAVLVLHGTNGSGAQFIRPDFAGELFGPGQLLDATRFFIVLPDNLGHGQSTRPSSGLRGAFPRYGYRDMITAQYRLLTEGLGVGRLRLVIGTSMGGMHAWLWGQMYPDFMDALMPLASVPAQIAGRNRMWRRIAMDAIRNDPGWRNGSYDTQPAGLRTAAIVLAYVSSNPVVRQQESPTLAAADAWIDAYVDTYAKTNDANDTLWALQASWDYDPAPGLGRIEAPLTAVNFADDLVNPPEIGILEREIARVPKGKAVIVPFGPDTRGHGSHTIAVLWKSYLADLLRRSSR